MSASSKLGLAYQTKVQNALKKEFTDSKYKLYTNQWFEYLTTDVKQKYCEIDAFLISPDSRRLYLFEIKYKHTEIAYFQMHNLYMPVLKAWKPKITIHPIELVRWYDANTPYPTRITMCSNPLLSDFTKFNVKIWNPQRNQRIC